MKAVILAGGLGTRLKPFTQVIPKPMLPLGEKSILEVQLSFLKKHGFDEIYLATNYRSEYIQAFFGDGSKYDVKLTISKEDKPLGTCGPLTLLSDSLDEPFLMMNGDILTTLSFSELYMNSLKNDALLTVVTKEIILPFQFGNVFHDGDYITGVEEKPDFRHEIIAGIHILKPQILQYIPKDTYFGIDTLIKLMLDKKLPIFRYLTKDYWIDIGRLGDYSEAQEVYEKHIQNHI